MTRCAYPDCVAERIVSNGTESYCRPHKNELARQVRHAGKAPEVITTETCQRAGCSNTFQVSSWGQAQRYCGAECRKGAPKAARAVARVERVAVKQAEAASLTEKACPGLPAKGDLPADPCGVKPIGEFYVVNGRPERLCKDHRKAQQRRYETADPERRARQARESQRRGRMAKITYEGRPMTEDDYAVELEAQKDQCKLCYKPLAEDVIHIDHDHETGAFRGLLCRSCNMSLYHSHSEEWYVRAGLYIMNVGDI